MCTVCVPGTCKDEKASTPHPLELEVLMVVTYPVGSGNPALLPCKSNQALLLIVRLSSPYRETSKDEHKGV